MQKFERRFATTVPSLQSRKNGDNEVTSFTGYAAVFFDGTPGSEYQLCPGLRERVMPTAFDRVIREKQDVRGFFNHDPNFVLGRIGSGTMRLAVDKRGLRYEIDFDQEDYDHQRVASKIKRGDVTGSSFSFVPTPNGQKFVTTGKGGDDIRELHDVDVFDVGPVSMPAYQSTSADVRSIFDAWQVARAANVGKGIGGAVVFAHGPVIRSRWDGDEALERCRRWASQGDGIDHRKLSRAFAWSDGGSSMGSHRLLHHDIRDGKLHVHSAAVKRCLRSLDSGNCGVPDDDVARVRSHLQRHADLQDEDNDGAELDRQRMREQLRRAEARVPDLPYVRRPERDRMLEQLRIADSRERGDRLRIVENSLHLISHRTYPLSPQEMAIYRAARAAQDLS